MPINAFPILTVPPTANLIINVPSGPITAIDVQTAINQLASLIPASGPGTDPLTLTQGLTVNTYNPNIGPSSDRMGTSFVFTSDGANVNTNYSITGAAEIVLNAMHGQGTYNAQTQAKTTFYGLGALATFYASGQKFLYSNTISSFGMGDTGLTGGNNITFAGGPIAGDEGQGWQMISNLQQLPFKAVTTISSIPAKSLVDTTTTQAIAASKDIQTVTVVSTAGAIINDWVVVEQEGPTATQNVEAVKIISFTATSITATFRCNHLNGVTITPALRLILVSTYACGQDRILVNLTQPGYSAGFITAITGGAWTGSGTAWADNMVGGYNLNIGVISLDADTYTASPYNGSPPNYDGLRSWYQISNASPTVLGVFTTSTAGDSGYHGKGPPPSGSGAPGSYSYMIKPAAKILRVMNSGSNLTQELILDTSTSTWAIGDTVECIICPYPDCTPYSWVVSAYTTGGAYRDFFSIRNGGGRKWNSIIRVWDNGPIYDATADGVAWHSFAEIESSFDYIIDGNAPRKVNIAFFALPTANSGPDLTDDSGKIMWNILYIKPNSIRTSLDFNVCQTPSGSGLLRFAGANVSPNPVSDLSMMEWPGIIRLTHGATANRSMLQIDRTTEPTNTDYITGQVRWNELNFPPDFGIVTRKFGTGGGGVSPADITLKPDNVEAFRCIAGGTVKFSASASFSANGSVATNLGSIGPTGSHTTVQTWLTVQDDTGTVRYIPCF